MQSLLTRDPSTLLLGGGRRRATVRPRPSLVLILTAVFAAPVAGQATMGRVVAADTEAPLAGVFITLTDSTGQRAAGSLSRVDGMFLIRAPGPGTYALRAELIGYGSVTESVMLTPGETVRRTLRLPLEAVQLEGLVVSAPRERQCSLSQDEGGTLARLWETARQGLRVAEWSAESGWTRASGYTYQRVLNLVDEEVLAETVQRRHSMAPHAFSAADPAVVREQGFVQRTEDGGAIYQGADAALLLSDAFMETHCFRLRDDPDEGRVGLAFEPTPDRREADIEGVLWLDAETARLQSLEYDYTRYPIPAPLPLSRFGGLTEFRHLPDGSVSVERWRIRMPSLMERADLIALRNARRCGRHACEDRETLRHLGRAGLAIEEEGGQVLSFRLPDGRTLPPAHQAAIAGVVLDSTAAGGPAPLSGAEVFIVGTEHRAVTDARGRFRLDNLPEGHYRLRFHHPRLAEAGIERPEAVLVRAETGAVETAALGLPSRGTLAVLRCGGSAGEGEARDPSSIVYGVVRDAQTGAAIQSAEVRLVRGARTTDAAVVAAQETDPAGRFLFCDVGETPVEVAAEFLGQGQTSLRVEPVPGVAARADLELVLSRAGRLLGRVVRADDGTGVAGALVRVADSRIQTTTNESGRFVLDSVQPGALMVETEHIGFQTSRGAVAISGGETVEVELRVADRVFELEPLVVTARSRPLLQDERMGGFYIRQARGLGTFFGTEEFEARPTARVTDFLREGTGLDVSRHATGTMIQGRRPAGLAGITGNQNPLCVPAIYLDGTLVNSLSPDDDMEVMTLAKEAARMLDQFRASDLAGIEVYPGPSSVPGEFAGLGVDCGVVVVWTRGSDRTR